MIRRPEGVRIVHPDGKETPVELAYNGLDDDGYHEWACVSVLRAGDELRVRYMPNRTCIVGPAEPPGATVVEDPWVALQLKRCGQCGTTVAVLVGRPAPRSCAEHNGE